MGAGRTPGRAVGQPTIARSATAAIACVRCAPASTPTALTLLEQTLRRLRMTRVSRCVERSFPVSQPRCSARLSTSPDVRCDRSGRPAAVDLAGKLADRSLSAAPRFRSFAGNGSPGEEDYAFVSVEGDGVHEIPVGPVHAGIIEPGHFRFSGRRREGAAARGAPRLRAQKASRNASKRTADTCRGHAGSPAACPAIPHGRLLAGLYAQALEAIAGCRRDPQRARCGCARSAWNASASRIISATSATSATTAGSPSAWRSSRA